MAGIAGIVRWDGAPVDRETLLRMLDAARHRGPDGTQLEIRDGVGFGHLRFLLREAERASTQPLWSRDGSLALVGDIRLYERRQLSQALQLPVTGAGQPGDAELVLAAFERWGPEAVQRLNGDFAFAIWDSRRRRLLAFRDPFGVKPLFYANEAQRLRVASEVNQLLVPEGPPADGDLETLSRLLTTGWPEAREKTFYSGIMRLLPGHVLEATPAGVSTSRWWNPAAHVAPLPPMRDAEYAEQFGELLRQAVERRIDVDVPTGLELSGGFDSSAVVLLAADVERTGNPSRDLVTISQQYPGLSCDESGFIAAVLEHCPFPSIRFDAPLNDYATALDDEIAKIAAPCPDVAWFRRSMGSALMRQHGCRLVLTGLGGDEVTWDPDYELDLLRSGQFLGAIRYCLRDERVLRGSEQAACLRRLARSVVPLPISRRFREWKRGRQRSVPDWLRVHAPNRDPGAAGEPGETSGQFDSVSQGIVYRWLTDPGFRWLIESEELLTAHHGFELRHPFLDRDLVEFVLSMPWESRYRQPGAFKTLLIAAMGHRMPAALVSRSGKSTFDDYFQQLDARGSSAVEKRVFETGQWKTAYLIDRARLQACRETMRRPEVAGTPEARAYWYALMTEIWLRRMS